MSIQQIKSGVIADDAVTAAKLDDTSTQLFGFRNRIINGEIRIDQRNAGANTVPSNNDYLADRFQINFAGSFAYQQNRGSVTPPAGFTNYLGIGATGSNSGSSALYAIRHNIEGNNIADFEWGTANAKTVTLSFWVRSNITGTYAVAFRSETGRSRLETYTISAANTWEYKTITVPGDTSGTWNTNTSTGLAVWFCYGGQNNQGPTGTWATADYRTVSGQANAVATNNDYFYLTGVQLEVGSLATPFERRPYGMELQLCQRYYEICQTSIRAPRDAENVYGVGIPFKVTKRATPTMTQISLGALVLNTTFNNFTATTTEGSAVQFNQTASYGYSYGYKASAASEL